MSLGEAVFGLSTDDSAFIAGLNKAESEARSAASNIASAFGDLVTGPFKVASAGLGLIQTGLRQVAIASYELRATANVIEDIGDAALGSAAKIETLTDRLAIMERGAGSLTSGLEKAQATMKGLQNFRIDTPFKLDDLAQAEIMLERMGIGGPKNLKLVADAAAVTGKSVSDLANPIARTYDALQSGEPIGRFTRQLMTAGAITPEVQAHLNAMEKQGASGAEMWNYLTQQLSQFNGAAQLLATSLPGTLTRVKESFKTDLGNAMQPMLDVVKAPLNLLDAWLNDPAHQAAANRLGKDLADGLTKFEVFVSGTLLPKAEALFTELRTGLAGVNWGNITALLDPLSTIAGNLLPTLIPAFINLAQLLSQIAGVVVPPLNAVLKGLSDILREHPGIISAVVAAWAGFKIGEIIANFVQLGASAVAWVGQALGMRSASESLDTELRKKPADAAAAKVALSEVGTAAETSGTAMAESASVVAEAATSESTALSRLAAIGEDYRASMAGGVVAGSAAAGAAMLELSGSNEIASASFKSTGDAVALEANQFADSTAAMLASNAEFSAAIDLDLATVGMAAEASGLRMSNAQQAFRDSVVAGLPEIESALATEQSALITTGMAMEALPAQTTAATSDMELAMTGWAEAVEVDSTTAQAAVTAAMAEIQISMTQASSSIGSGIELVESYVSGLPAAVASSVTAVEASTAGLTEVLQTEALSWEESFSYLDLAVPHSPPMTDRAASAANRISQIFQNMWNSVGRNSEQVTRSLEQIGAKFGDISKLDPNLGGAVTGVQNLLLSITSLKEKADALDIANMSQKYWTVAPEALQSFLTATSEMQGLADSVAQARDKFSDQQDAVDGLKESILNLKIEAIPFKDELADQKEKLQDLKGPLTDLKDQYTADKDALSDLTQQLKDAKAEVKSFKDGLNDIKLAEEEPFDRAKSNLKVQEDSVRARIAEIKGSGLSTQREKHTVQDVEGRPKIDPKTGATVGTTYSLRSHTVTADESPMQAALKPYENELDKLTAQGDLIDAHMHQTIDPLKDKLKQLAGGGKETYQTFDQLAQSLMHAQGEVARLTPLVDAQQKVVLGDKEKVDAAQRAYDAQTKVVTKAQQAYDGINRQIEHQNGLLDDANLRLDKAKQNYDALNGALQALSTSLHDVNSLVGTSFDANQRAAQQAQSVQEAAQRKADSDAAAAQRKADEAAAKQKAAADKAINDQERVNTAYATYIQDQSDATIQQQSAQSSLQALQQAQAKFAPDASGHFKSDVAQKAYESLGIKIDEAGIKLQQATLKQSEANTAAQKYRDLVTETGKVEQANAPQIAQAEAQAKVTYAQGVVEIKKAQKDLDATLAQFKETPTSPPGQADAFDTTSPYDKGSEKDKAYQQHASQQHTLDIQKEITDAYNAAHGLTKPGGPAEGGVAGALMKTDDSTMKIMSDVMIGMMVLNLTSSLTRSSGGLAGVGSKIIGLISQGGELTIPGMALGVVGSVAASLYQGFQAMNEISGGHVAEGVGRGIGTAVGLGVGLAIPGIGPLIAPVTAMIGGEMGAMIGDNWPAIKSAFSDLGSSIANALGGIGSWIGSNWPTIVEGIFIPFTLGFSLWIPWLVQHWGTIVSDAGKILGGLKDIAGNVITGFWNGVVAAWNAVIFPGPWGGLWSGLLNSVKAQFGISSPSTEFFNIGINIINGLWDGISGAWKPFTTWMNDRWNDLKSLPKKLFGISSPSSEMFNVATDMVAGLSNSMGENWPKFMTYMGQNWTDFKNQPKDYKLQGSPSPFLHDVGTDMVTGLQNGVDDSWLGFRTGVQNKLTDLGEQTHTGGQNVVIRFANGLKEKAEDLKNAALQVFGGVADAINHMFPGLLPGLQKAFNIIGPIMLANLGNGDGASSYQPSESKTPAPGPSSGSPAGGFAPSYSAPSLPGLSYQPPPLIETPPETTPPAAYEPQQVPSVEQMTPTLNQIATNTGQTAKNTAPVPHSAQGQAVADGIQALIDQRTGKGPPPPAGPSLPMASTFGMSDADVRLQISMAQDNLYQLGLAPGSDGKFVWQQWDLGNPLEMDLFKKTYEYNPSIPIALGPMNQTQYSNDLAQVQSNFLNRPGVNPWVGVDKNLTIPTKLDMSNVSYDSGSPDDMRNAAANGMTGLGAGSPDYWKTKRLEDYQMGKTKMDGQYIYEKWAGHVEDYAKTADYLPYAPIATGPNSFTDPKTKGMDVSHVVHGTGPRTTPSGFQEGFGGYPGAPGYQPPGPSPTNPHVATANASDAVRSVRGYKPGEGHAAGPPVVLQINNPVVRSEEDFQRLAQQMAVLWAKYKQRVGNATGGAGGDNSVYQVNA